MKKLLIIITLFVSSFFLISVEDTKAAEAVINFNDYSLVSSDDFNNVKLLAEETLSSTGYSHYMIFYYENVNDTTKNRYDVYYFKNTNLYTSISLKPSSSVYDYHISIGSTSSGYSLYRYNISKGNLSQFTSNTSSSILVHITSYGKDNGEYLYYLYSDVSVIHNYYYTNVDLKINYPHNTYVFNNDNLKTEIPSLYSEYVLNSGSPIIPNNPHQEEIDKVTNFYTIVIEKITYLAEQIANNYILLFIIGIFILTFVFLLIFRRFL